MRDEFHDDEEWSVTHDEIGDEIGDRASALVDVETELEVDVADLLDQQREVAIDEDDEPRE
jgi:hypothetical protein